MNHRQEDTIGLKLLILLNKRGTIVERKMEQFAVASAPFIIKLTGSLVQHPLQPTVAFNVTFNSTYT
ncbi:hypothetical protein, partial [Paenibacillus sp. NRS-1760]|uniref:hypothetical protein n=1 Tax=Paenibacillus sp. NRS-1760 TaxID=3233902 RepID=UPI003D2C4B38